MFSLYSTPLIQAGTKCVHDQNCARIVHTIALTVRNKSCTLFLLKKIVICFDSFKFLLLTYFHKKRKRFYYFIPFTISSQPVSTLLNIPAVITAEMFTKGKNPVINSVVYCKTAPAANLSFLLFLVSTCLSIPRNVKWSRN